MEKIKQGFLYLEGGGEMGEIVRNYNWAASPLGTPEQWPQSLRTTLGIILHSAFPMFLFWGKELTCFYNDAYRAIMGNEGRHPAVGKPGKEVWPEVWNFIGPLIDQVMTTGEPVWFEDQPLPIYRNGRMEDGFWTFSYSPVYGDDGTINGVFVTCSETTASIRNLQQVQESEDRFRTMSEGTDIMIGVGDEHGKAVYFNKAWADLTGRPLEELMDDGWVDLVHPNDKEKYLGIIYHALERKIPFSGEFRMENREGDYSWLLVKGSPRFRSDGSFAGFISSCVNITERKQAEEAFAESELRLRALIESAPFPIGVYIGREMKVAFANQSIIKVWGKGEDVIGKLFKDVLPELDSQEVLVQLDNVFTTGIPFHIRHQQLDLEVDGTLQTFYFNYSLTPLFDQAGNVYGVMNTGADVTDLNIAKQHIEQSEKNFRSMVLQSPVAMCILRGPSYVIEVANELMIELWGKPVADVMYKPVFEALPDAKEQGLEQLMDNVYNTGESFRASERPVVLLRKGKLETVYQNFVYDPYLDADGSILGVIAISIDVTAQVLARQKIEEVVSERTRELATSNAELAQFAYIASHDLQEPVRKISTFLQMLEQSLGPLEERPKSYLDKINNATARMLTLIRDVLGYSQLSKEIKSFTTVNLQQIVKEATIDFELLIEQKQAEIIYENLPTIAAIPLQMAQLFGNLISNALKFSRSDVKPVIRITATALPDAHYKIEVSDNGIGFDEQYADQIFHIFQRLHRKTEFAGTGIGLATCKKIVQNHHGDIYASSVKGSGAVFTIILPAEQKG